MNDLALVTGLSLAAGAVVMTIIARVARRGGRLSLAWRSMFLHRKPRNG